MIRYISTRGPGRPLSFEHVLLSGMAPDGGLYLPDSWPILDRQLLSHMQGLSYSEIAFQVMRPFVGDSIPPAVLQRIITETYSDAAFDHPAVAPLMQIGPNAWVLELFRGPTLSFKDYALQFLGRLFDYVLEQKGARITIVGATSGDTGSAAIEACRACKNIDIFILHPKGRVSDVQRRQMTSVIAPNVFNIAVDGTFDDCQAIVKGLFADETLRASVNLSAVNSINWVRIMAQIVYYVTSAIALGAPERSVSFSVPTGNFGNVFAGWAARNMGLPIHSLNIATNRNDIITRFFESGEMKPGAVEPSISPSMDIQVSSNFERYLCELTGNDHDAIRSMMDRFARDGSYTIGSALHAKAKREFFATRCSDDETTDIMRECFHATGMQIDPHTAVGLKGAIAANARDPSVPVITLACAHPAKFGDAVARATGLQPEMPARLSAVMNRTEQVVTMSKDIEKIKEFVKSQARAGK